MQRAIQSFLDQVNKRSHVRELLKDRDILLSIVTEEESILIRFYDGEAFLVKNQSVYEEIDICIQGSVNMLLCLLSGKQKLRELAKHENLKLAGTYRSSLLMESLFYLCKTENLSKIF